MNEVITINGVKYKKMQVTEETQTELKRTGLGRVDGVKTGDKYYLSDINGEIVFVNAGNIAHKETIEHGDAYTDRQLAKDTARATRIRNALRDYAAAHNKVALDWRDNGQMKYYLCYAFVDDIPEIRGCCTVKEDTTYFDSRETAEAAIEAVGRDDVTWLLRDFNPWIGAYKGVK